MEDQEVEDALEMIKAVSKDGEAEINGRTYVLTKMNHKTRRKIFSCYSKHRAELHLGDYSFLETKEFETVEKIINNLVLFEGSLLSRLPDHWEKYPQDYIYFIFTMLGVITYPFFHAVDGD